MSRPASFRASLFFINEVIECLAEVERLHIQHDLRYGMLLGRRMLRRRTFTPLAGSQPRKRQLFCA